ncbi:MAG: NAD-glutamate dehydrogenase, partial [Verrucomicrobia bacterium]|nr:NAD-glutamate dehydrogenase [Verrucomicrobiota bacterium]
TTLYFTEAVETGKLPLPKEKIDALRVQVQERNPELTDHDLKSLLSSINTRFLSSLPLDRLALALDMFFRAKTRDHCQYEVRYNDNWQTTGIPSMQVVLAWRNTPKLDFLYRLARLVKRHGLVMQQVNATYIDPYGKRSILIMAIGLHGSLGQAAWEAADVPDFLRELVTLKYFGGFTEIIETFVTPGLLRGNLANLLKSMAYFIHQVLLNVDPHFYTLASVTEALCRHPQLTVQVCEAFEAKFDPDKHNLKHSEEICKNIEEQIKLLDTGHEVNDIRRKNVLHQAVVFVRYTLKTNFYRNNKCAFSFRLDPHYLDEAPFDRQSLFPELPFAIFFIKGMHYLGFHIRFRDLARGGLRTVFPESHEQMAIELNGVFREAYGLAYTQQKKNKDIPEGGAKAVIFLKPYERLKAEQEILQRELQLSDLNPEEIELKLRNYVREEKTEYLEQTQRTFVDALLSLVNCYPDGTLKAKHIVDYYKKPEYLYLGPDERLESPMLQWIAQHSKRYGYKPGGSFISSKPLTGINHKEYGVTSLGVNVYMHEMLKYLDIDPAKQPFTVKISGGPDGDVAGNQILNLYRDCPNTAKLVAITDISGTIRDDQGLDLKELVTLFHAARPISFYPPDKLSEGAFLLDRRTTKEESAYVQKTLCWRKIDGVVVRDWVSSNEASRLFHTNLHQTPADIFIPAGGRPRALNEGNLEEFLTPEGAPTARGIVEGANLYLTPKARILLQDRGVLVIKDSSANKCGVICSSFEVLEGLVLSEEEILEHKKTYVAQVLQILRSRALDEAHLLLGTHRTTGQCLTDLSDQTSEKINAFTDQLLSFLEPLALPSSLADPLNLCFESYAPPLLRERYRERLHASVPEGHKKAIIASKIASNLVYHRGLDWHPSVVEVLPLLWKDQAICGPNYGEPS